MQRTFPKTKSQADDRNKDYRTYVVVTQLNVSAHFPIYHSMLDTRGVRSTHEPTPTLNMLVRTVPFTELLAKSCFHAPDTFPHVS